MTVPGRNSELGTQLRNEVCDGFVRTKSASYGGVYIHLAGAFVGVHTGLEVGLRLLKTMGIFETSKSG